MSKTLKEHNFFGFDATIVADSLNPQGDRLTTMVLTYPRIIHAEFMTHRVFSRNSASSRAIPFKKMVERVKSNPYIPIAFQKDHSGMQGSEYFTDPIDIQYAQKMWLAAMQSAVGHAEILSSTGITKQICNRLLESFLWHTVIVTATEFDNFFELRCPIYEVGGETTRSKEECLALAIHYDPEFYAKYRDASDLDWLQINKSGADIHIQAIAEPMYDALYASTPKRLKENEWHIPFADDIDLNKLYETYPTNDGDKIRDFNTYQSIIRKISVALCARLSYGNISADGDYAKDIALYDRLAASRHASPFEHVAKTMSDSNYYLRFKGTLRDAYKEKGEEDDFIQAEIDIDSDDFGWVDNFKGFVSERHIIGV